MNLKISGGEIVNYVKREKVIFEFPINWSFSWLLQILDAVGALRCPMAAGGRVFSARFSASFDCAAAAGDAVAATHCCRWVQGWPWSPIPLVFTQNRRVPQPHRWCFRKRVPAAPGSNPLRCPPRPPKTPLSSPPLEFHPQPATWRS